jgi:DNA-binding transcriptional LysR family regulator
MVRLADRMGEEILAYERKVTGRDLRPSGELRITTNDLVLLHLLTDVLVGFRRQYPEITLDVVISNQILNLSKRDADIAVRATYHAPEGLAGQRVGHIAWAAFGPAEWKGKPFDAHTDAPNHDWIGLADHVALARVTKWLRDHGADKRTVYKVNTMLGFAEAVAGGMGLALLPCFIGGRVPGLARLSAPLPELEGELWVLTHPDLRSTARVRAFVDFCAAEFATQRKILECLPTDSDA